MNTIYRLKSLRSLLIIGCLLMYGQAYAEAGRVVFSYGTVTAEDEDGEITVISKRDAVDPGDLIRTGPNSMVQIRMIDKAFIALRSNSEFKIEQYQLGATKEEDVGIFSLLKGGFRAVTGIIGKRLRSAYKVQTATATIGIRGTDYTARLCQQDCKQGFANVSGGSIDDGLYVGVNEGGINLANQLGTLSLDELQFGYVKDATSAPVALPSAPEFLYFNSQPPNPEAVEQQAETPTIQSLQDTVVASRSSVEPPAADVTTSETVQQDLKIEKTLISQEQIEENVVVEQVAATDDGITFSLTDGSDVQTSQRVVATYSSGNSSSIKSSLNDPGNIGVSGFALNRFTLPANSTTNIITQGTADSIELGYDPDTGIAWGRWGGGLAQVQTASDGINTLNLQNSSLHWILGPEQTSSIALPSTGTASYDLVGNTSPTDNLGNTGILGEATLSADFVDMTVDSNLSIGINQQVWNASATDLPIVSSGAFSGNFNSVTVNTIESGSFNGSGTANGFFTPNADAAGLGYALEAQVEGVSTILNGTAIFQKR